MEREARGGYGLSGRRTTPWQTPMNLIFSYSRVVAGRRLWHLPNVDSERRTSELVGPSLPRPLTSHSCGAPRHSAPALTRVGCGRVSGTRMETLVDTLGDILWNHGQILSSLVTGASPRENSIQYPGTLRVIGVGITPTHRTRYPVPCYLD